MRKTLLILVLAASSVMLFGFQPKPAEARVFWSIGSGFSVGGLDFSLVFGRPDGLYGSVYGDGYFFRLGHRLHYGGYSCNDGCSYRSGYYYHHPDCAVVRYHFRRHRFLPLQHLTGAPWFYGSRGRQDWNRYNSRPLDRYRYDRNRNDRHRQERYRYDSHRYDKRRYDKDRYRYRGRDRNSDRDSDRWDRQRDSRRDEGRRKDGDYRRNERDRRQQPDARRRPGRDTRSRGRRN